MHGPSSHLRFLDFESFSAAINLAYIKKNCWNLDDPTVIFLGTRKARVRGSEGPSSVAPQTSTALAPIPSAPVSTTSGPSSQSTDLMMSMLQSIHQGQYLEAQPDLETAPPAQEDDSKVTPPESFVPETDPEADPMIAEASP
ncbi:hypothetical protein HKD37_16G045348 [Glycine soja]